MFFETNLIYYFRLKRVQQQQNTIQKTKIKKKSVFLLLKITKKAKNLIAIKVKCVKNDNNIEITIYLADLIIKNRFLFASYLYLFISRVIITVL